MRADSSPSLGDLSTPTEQLGWLRRCDAEPGFTYEHPVLPLDARPVRVPVHDDVTSSARGSARCETSWTTQDAHAADGHARDLAQVEAGQRVVAVAEHRRDGRDRLELVEHVGSEPMSPACTIAVERPSAAKRVDRARVEPAVRVRDEPDAHDAAPRRRAIVAATYSPSAFLSAGTRRRETGICVAASSASVSSSVPPYIGTTSLTRARLTR